MSKIKEMLKKSHLIKIILIKANRNIVAFLVKRSPIFASKYLYFIATEKKLNLKNPKDFNEKLQWIKLFWQHPLVTKCADKYEVREYVKSFGCEEILNELYGVYEDTSEIDWSRLPHKFALKATHGCGFNIICDDKEKLNKKEAINKLRKWLKTDYSLQAAELHYSKMKPRIICEKYIETDAGFLPNDYKIYCFNGKARLILVCSERGSKLKLDFLDLNWERVDVGSSDYNKGKAPLKPKCYEDIIKYAEKLSKPFPFVRVDFYILNDKPLLGEMTFTPAACSARYYNKNGLKILGDMLELPEKYVAV